MYRIVNFARSGISDPIADSVEVEARQVDRDLLGGLTDRRSAAAARVGYHASRHSGRDGWRRLAAVSCNGLLASSLPATQMRGSSMEMAFTAVFKKVPEGFIAFVEEIPGTNTQGATLEEARENLREAVELVLEANRALAREEADEGEIIREPMKIAAG